MIVPIAVKLIILQPHRTIKTEKKKKAQWYERRYVHIHLNKHQPFTCTIQHERTCSMFDHIPDPAKLANIKHYIGVLESVFDHEDQLASDGTYYKKSCA